MKGGLPSTLAKFEPVCTTLLVGVDPTIWTSLENTNITRVASPAKGSPSEEFITLQLKGVPIDRVQQKSSVIKKATNRVSDLGHAHFSKNK
jgi:hypothetical protein